MGLQSHDTPSLVLGKNASALGPEVWESTLGVSPNGGEISEDGGGQEEWVRPTLPLERLGNDRRHWLWVSESSTLFPGPLGLSPAPCPGTLQGR